MNLPNAKTRQGKQRKPSLLDEVLEHRMLLYALTAGATLAAVAPSAAAKVVFTPSNAVLTQKNGTLQIDLNNDGVTDFVLLDEAFWYHSTNSSVRRLRRRPPLGSSFLVYDLIAQGTNAANTLMDNSNPTGWAEALKNGAKVGQGGFFSQTGWMANSERGESYGAFINVRNRYLGVRFEINGTSHYGWIGFKSVSGVVDGGYKAKLLGWAYETEPNTPIIAGSGQGAVFQDSAALRSAGPENVPAMRAAEPTSLELLAAGHVAVADWRRRRAA
jgi:hypothetical protein